MIKKRWLLFLILLFLSSGTFVYADSAPLTLSLDEAIFLSIRNNPAVQNIRLNYITQKFSLRVAEWQFKPHYIFNTNYNYVRNVEGEKNIYQRGLNISPGVSLLTDVGTNISVTGNTTDIGNLNPGVTLNVTQPLMRGFGKPIVEQALNDARDSLYTSGLNVKSTLQNTVTSVINSYLDVVSAERNVVIDEQALARAQSSVDQTKKFIKAGHKAGNEIITVEAGVASAQSTLANDQNNLRTTKYALLSAIGLDPNTEIKFTSIDLDDLTQKYSMPNLDETKDLVLASDIQYQIDQLTLNGSSARALMSAKDNQRWQLNATANISTGNFTNNKNSTIIVNNNPDSANNSSVYNGITQAQTIGLSLNIPIDDQSLEQNVENQKIAIKEAQINLQKEKWDIQTNAINGWNLVESAKRSLQFAISAENLQEQTYKISYQKYLHGLIDSLQLQSAQSSLIQSQQSLLNARISYLKSLVGMDQLIGNTLKTWNVPVRLP